MSVYPHTVSGSDRLSEAMTRAYLESSGYAAEAGPVMEEARRYPGTYAYTGDRHRYTVYRMPGAYWEAGDCAESEERIKALGRARRAGRRA